MAGVSSPAGNLFSPPSAHASRPADLWSFRRRGGKLQFTKLTLWAGIKKSGRCHPSALSWPSPPDGWKEPSKLEFQSWIADAQLSNMPWTCSSLQPPPGISLQRRRALRLPAQLYFLSHAPRKRLPRPPRASELTPHENESSGSGDIPGRGGFSTQQQSPSFLETLPPWRRWSLAAIGVALLTGVAWTGNLGVAGLIDDTEPLFAESARQMLLSGDWVTPQFNGHPRFDKPPLLYWLMAASMRLLGPHVWALRLPSSISGMLLTVAIAVTAGKFGLDFAPEGAQGGRQDSAYEDRRLAEGSAWQRWTGGTVAAAAFALSLGPVVWGSLALTDMLLTASSGGALLAFFWSYATSWQRGYDMAAVLATLALLTKGPIGLVLPGLICVIFLSYTGELHQVALKEVPWPRVLSIIFCGGVPWYAAMWHRHGSAYLATFFGYHNMERFARGVNHHGGRPLWFGVAALVLLYLPWSFSLPRAATRLALLTQRARWRMAPRTARLPLLAAAWVAGGFGIFALSASQLPQYYLPLGPGLALLVAAHLVTPEPAEVALGGQAAPATRWAWPAMVASCLYAIGGGLIFAAPSIVAKLADPKTAEIAAQIAAQRLHARALFIFLAAAVATAAASRTGQQTSPSTAPPLWAVHLASMVLVISIFVRPAYRAADFVLQRPARHLAAVAAELQGTNEALAMVGPRLPSVVFYSKQTPKP